MKYRSYSWGPTCLEYPQALPLKVHQATLPDPLQSPDWPIQPAYWGLLVEVQLHLGLDCFLLDSEGFGLRESVEDL